MGRHQTGYLFKTSGGWHVRFWITELRDGQPVRVQRSEKLCDAKAADGENVTKSEAKTLRDEHMKGINAISGTLPTHDMTVKEFWEARYLPHIERPKDENGKRRGLRASTIEGYKHLWKHHLEPHFVATGLTLRKYDTPQATMFLTSLADKGLGRRSIAHIRSLASGIFRHAKQVGVIKGENPWRESASLSKPKEPEPTEHYSLEEAEVISNALYEANRQREQLIFCIATFAGLRPGEIIGLRWPDVCENEERQIGNGSWIGWLDIRRSVVCGEVDDTKTDASGKEDNPAPVPLIPHLRAMFSAWRKECGSPTEGWVFENRIGDPINLDVLGRRIFKPILKEKWKGLYSGRRSAGTLLTQLTGNALAGFFVLRPKDFATTTGYYVKALPEPAVEGVRLLGKRMAERKTLTASNDAQ